MRGLTLPAIAAVPLDLPYVTYTQFVDTQIAALQLTGWDKLVKPWFDVWLPEATAEAYVTDVLSHLKPEDIAPTGFILLFAQRRSKLTRPFLRVPAAEHGEWVYLFDILNASALPGPDPGFARKMLDRNRRWFERARDAGGMRYPIGSLEFSGDDWRRHYGEQWPRLQRIKRRYDPDAILTPGPGIF
jgi:FAD/FMN-containing dehydrogenase